MRAYWGLFAVGVLAASQAKAVTLTEDLSAMAGDWQGTEVAAVGHPVGTFHLTLTPVTPTGVLLAKGHLGAGGDGNGLLAGQDFELVQSGDAYFALTSSDGTPAGAFTVEHAPFGGLRFHRLVQAGADAQLGVQSEEVLVGKLAANGSRRVKVTRGGRLCRDASGVEAACGAAETRIYSIKR